MKHARRTVRVGGLTVGLASVHSGRSTVGRLGRPTPPFDPFNFAISIDGITLFQEGTAHATSGVGDSRLPTGLSDAVATGSGTSPSPTALTARPIPRSATLMPPLPLATTALPMPPKGITTSPVSMISPAVPAARPLPLAAAGTSPRSTTFLAASAAGPTPSARTTSPLFLPTAAPPTPAWGPSTSPPSSLTI